MRKFAVGIAAVLAFSGTASVASAQSVRVMGDIGFMNYSGSGSMTGTDTTAPVPAPSQSQSLSHTTAAGGGMVEMDLLGGRRDPAAAVGAQQGALSNSPGLFTNEGGSLAGLFSLYLAAGLSDPGRATASFANLNPIPLGTGTSNLRETWSIPLHLGLRAPARTFGINAPGLEFLVHGGVNIDQWNGGFSLTELGAPGGPGTSASKTWWSADPAVGVGARYWLTRAWFMGVDSTWAFTRSQNIGALSANFAPLQSYNLSTGNHTTTTVMFNLGYAFDFSPVAPLVTKR